MALLVLLFFAIQLIHINRILLLHLSFVVEAAFVASCLHDLRYHDIVEILYACLDHVEFSVRCFELVLGLAHLFLTGFLLRSGLAARLTEHLLPSGLLGGRLIALSLRCTTLLLALLLGFLQLLPEAGLGLLNHPLGRCLALLAVVFILHLLLDALALIPLDLLHVLLQLFVDLGLEGLLFLLFHFNLASEVRLMRRKHLVDQLLVPVRALLHVFGVLGLLHQVLLQLVHPSHLALDRL